MLVGATTTAMTWSDAAGSLAYAAVWLVVLYGAGLLHAEAEGGITMSLGRTWKVLRKDLALGPRSPFFLYAIVLPFVLTLIFQFAFGSLFDPQPRLGIVDDGDSEITAAVEEMDGIELTLLDDAEELKTQVEQNDLDAGLILPAGFDQAVKDGEQPPTCSSSSAGRASPPIASSSRHRDRSRARARRSRRAGRGRDRQLRRRTGCRSPCDSFPSSSSTLS